jgi:hypothetical protein
VSFDAVGHFSSKVEPTYNKQVSYVAVLFINVYLNTNVLVEGIVFPMYNHNAMQSCNGSGDDPRLKRDSAELFEVTL